MKIKKLVKLAPMMLLTFLLGLSGCSGSTSADARVNDHPSEADEELHVLTIGTADSGGTMYPVGSAIASVLSGHDEQLKVNLSASNGSYTNVENIKNGQFDMGLVSGDVAFSAYQGTDEFSGHPVESLRAIGAVYSSLSTWMAPESEHISYVHELAGHHIAVGPEGSTTELSARTALKAAGLNIANTALENYSFSASVDSVLNGKLDAVHSFAGIPVHSLTDLASQTPCRLLEYTDEELQKILAASPFYVRATVPAGTYPGQTETLKTFGIKCLLCVDASMDEQLVYTITKILDESREELISTHPSLSNGNATAPCGCLGRRMAAMQYAYNGLDIVQIRRWTEEIRKTTAEDQKEAARIIRRLLEEAWIVTTGNQTAIEMDRDCFDRIRDFRSKMAE